MKRNFYKIKESFIITLTCLFLSSSVFAQSPEKMSYQAVIRNSSNQLLGNAKVGMQLSILQGSASGPVVYTEVQSPTTNDNGLISIELGEGSGFSAIDWANGIYFIKTETDPTGGNDYTITGTSQLLSVPYALHAKTAENVAGGFKHYIGELYGGGIVVAVWKEVGVEKGLIASLTDISDGIPFSSVTGTSIGVTSQSVVDGQANTTAILAQGDISGAAFLCDHYSVGSYNDWYLPATWEMHQCYNAAFVVNTILGSTNGFKFEYYWTSTEDYDNYVCGQGFNTGHTDGMVKTELKKVRAVRRF